MNHELFMRLLRYALWGTPFTLHHDEAQQVNWDDILSLADQQAVYGLVAQALIDNNIPLTKQQAVTLYARLRAIRTENEHINRELIAFCRALNRRNIRYVVVKGQTLAALYPQPLLRTPGDIDFYVHPSDFQRTKTFIEQRLHTTLGPLTGEGRHIEFSHNDIVFELHRTLSTFTTPSNTRHFDQLIEEAVGNKRFAIAKLEHSAECIVHSEENDNSALCTSPKDACTSPKGACTSAERACTSFAKSEALNVLYTFSHLFHHLIAGGIGLRQFCDLAILIHNANDHGLNGLKNGNENENENGNDNENANNKTNHTSHLSLVTFHLDKAFSAVCAYLVDYLGLPESELPITLTAKDHRWSARIHRNVMRNGNFGRTRRKVEQLGFLHSLESAWITLRQTLLFFPLAPREVLGHLPHLLLSKFRTNDQK